MMKKLFYLLVGVLLAGAARAGEIHYSTTVYRDFEFAGWAPTATVAAITVVSNGGAWTAAQTGTWHYALAATNDKGQTINGPVTSTTVTVTGSYVRVTWQPLGGASGYLLYRGSTATNLTNYVVTGVVTSYTDYGTNAWSVGVPTNTVTYMPRLFMSPGHVATGANEVVTKNQLESSTIQTNSMTNALGGAYVVVTYTNTDAYGKTAVITVTGVVDLVSVQTVGGSKTFTATITGNTSIWDVASISNLIRRGDAASIPVVGALSWDGDTNNTAIVVGDDSDLGSAGKAVRWVSDFGTQEWVMVGSYVYRYDNLTRSTPAHKMIFEDMVTNVLQTRVGDMDYLADANGRTLQVHRIYVPSNAWRVLYVDGDTNVIELALGANGTALLSSGPSSTPGFGVVTATATNIPMAGITDLVATNTNSYVMIVYDPANTNWHARVFTNAVAEADIVAMVRQADGAGSGLDADFLDGYSHADFLNPTSKASKVGADLSGPFSWDGDTNNTAIVIGEDSDLGAGGKAVRWVSDFGTQEWVMVGSYVYRYDNLTRSVPARKMLFDDMITNVFWSTAAFAPSNSSATASNYTISVAGTSLYVCVTNSYFGSLTNWMRINMGPF